MATLVLENVPEYEQAMDNGDYKTAARVLESAKCMGGRCTRSRCTGCWIQGEIDWLFGMAEVAPPPAK